MAQQAGRPKGRRHYTEAEKAQALALYEANGKNLTRTSRESGIPENTIRRWVEDPERAAPSQVRAETKADPIALLDRAIEACLVNIPSAATGERVKPNELSLAAAQLIDKKRLLTGEAVPGEGGGEPVRIELTWPSYDDQGKVVPFRRGAA